MSAEPPVVPRALEVVARSGLESSVAPEQPSEVDSILDDATWTELVHRCGSNRIMGLLGTAVEAGEVPVSDAQYEHLVAALRTELSSVLVIEQHLLRILDVLRDAGVDARALKGPAVAHLDYSDPAMRLFSDVDLLVHPTQFDAAIETIVGTGVDRRFAELRPGFDRRFSKGVEFFAEDEPEIDLHRTFVMGPFGLRIDLADLWATSEEFTIAGREIAALDPDVRFLHACYHVALGGVPVRLMQLRDVPQLIFGGRVDLDRAMELARAWKSEPVIARAVQLAWDELKLGDHDLAHWARRYVVSARDQRALRTYLDPEMGYAARCLAALSDVHGVRQKLAFGFGLAFPSREFGAGRHRGHRERWRRALADLRRLAILPRGRSDRNGR